MRIACYLLMFFFNYYYFQYLEVERFVPDKVFLLLQTFEFSFRLQVVNGLKSLPQIKQIDIYHLFSK
jgi:hypothetical protein